MNGDIKTKHELKNEFITEMMTILGRRRNKGNDANYEAAEAAWKLLEPYIVINGEC